MKPTVILLILSLFAIQFVPTNTAHLEAEIPERDGPYVPHYKAFQVLFNLPNIVTGFLDYQDTLRSLAQLYQYFLNEKLFKNLLHGVFRLIDKDQNGVVSREEYETLLRDAGIELSKAQRAYALAAIENPSRDLGFSDFEVALEILLDESISTVTFAYLLGTPEQSPYVGIDKQTLTSGLEEIWSKLPAFYPKPGYDQLAYLFDRFDMNGDGLLDPEGFFRTLSIFLRYYKAGLSNSAYAQLVRRDNVFALLWQREIAEAAFKVQQLQLQEALDDFFQMAVFERVLSTVAQNIFKLIDENGNGTVELDEFRKAIALFQAPESEAVLLFETADTDASGSLDFGEFLHVFESFTRKSLTKVAHVIFQTNGRVTDQPKVTALWMGLAAAHGIDVGLTEDAFKVLYDQYDVDHNGMLDIGEFTEFTAIVVTTIKKLIRKDIDVLLNINAARNATNANIEEATQEKLIKDTADFNQDVATSQAILSRILGRASVETSAFSAFAASGFSGDTSGGDTSNGLTANVEGTEDLSQSLDSGHAPGIAIGFGLYDAVREATQTNTMDQLTEKVQDDPLEPLGMKVLLQGQLGDLVKFAK